MSLETYFVANKPRKCAKNGFFYFFTGQWRGRQVSVWTKHKQIYLINQLMHKLLVAIHNEE